MVIQQGCLAGLRNWRQDQYHYKSFLRGDIMRESVIYHAMILQRRYDRKVDRKA
ncbi:hypothetical protein OSCI_3730006 [Kamptonema sp. PCC 6506]|nr:hypothetical protein OSCI_3730006 [Kamptonema sp. PCC 6506]